MPRKGPAPKRPVVNDPVYGAPIVTQLVNKILVDGKKSLAESIVYDALKRSRAAASAARPTRFPSRSSRTARTPSRCAGSSPTRRVVVRRR